MSTTNASAKIEGQIPPLPAVAPATSFTLRDLYIRAGISGNSLSAELQRYLNIDETTFSSLTKVNAQTQDSNHETDVHELAIAAILEVVASNSRAALKFDRIAEPPEGMQEWWARKQSGTPYNRHAEVGDSATSEPK